MSYDNTSNIKGAPDLTGTAPTHKGKMQIKVFKAGQTLVFGGPVFANSTLKVIRKSNNNDSSQESSLVFGIDYEIHEHDDTTMSQIKAADASFNDVLCFSIRFIQTPPSPYDVEVRYQALYPLIDGHLHNTKSIEFSPDLLTDILRRLSSAELFMKSPFDQVPTPAQNLAESNISLEVDLKANLEQNFIKDENHDVNVVENKSYINPIYGSFYKKDFKVFDREINQELVYGTDYVFKEFNSSLTEQSEENIEVFDFVQIINSAYSKLRIEYRAFGGCAPRGYLEVLKNNLVALGNIVGGSNPLNYENLPDAPIIQHIIEKLDYYEEIMRQLGIGVTYGDTTDGVSRVQSLSFPNQGFHWYNIATLYKVDGSTTTHTADTYKCRIDLPEIKYQFGLNVAVNIEKSKDPVSVSVQDVVCENGYDGYSKTTNQSDLDKLTSMAVRVIWVDDPGLAFGGAILQFGMLSLNKPSTIFHIEDVSGKQSAWITGENVSSLNPSNDGVILPNGATTWNDGGPSSKKYIHYVKKQLPSLMYMDNLNYLDLINNGINETLDPKIIATDIELNGFSKFIVSLVNESGIDYDAIIPVRKQADNNLTALGMVFVQDGENEDTASLPIKLSLEKDNLSNRYIFKGSSYGGLPSSEQSDYPTIKRITLE